MQRAPVTPPRHRRLYSTPSPVTARPSPPRRSELPLCAIEARRRLIRAAQEGMGLTDECEFSPEYLAGWNDPDVDEYDAYFRVRKEEEERIQNDLERAMLAKNRARARKAAQEAGLQSHGGDRYPSSPHFRHDHADSHYDYMPRPPPPAKTPGNSDLERYRFPVSPPATDEVRSLSNFAPAVSDSPPVPPKARARRGRMIPLPARVPKTPDADRGAASFARRSRTSSTTSAAPSYAAQGRANTRASGPPSTPPPTPTGPRLVRPLAAPPASPPKRLAPLSRFNPFMTRPRSESLSSVIEEGKVGMPEHANLHHTKPAANPPSSTRKLKRANTVQDVFSKIHREASLLASGHKAA